MRVSAPNRVDVLEESAYLALMNCLTLLARGANPVSQDALATGLMMSHSQGKRSCRAVAN